MGLLARTSLYSIPMPPLIDLSYLQRLYKGDHACIAEWVGIFLEEIPTHLEEMAQCAARGDATGLSALAHDLRPQAHYLGAQAMLDVLGRLSLLAQCAEVGPCKEAVRELHSICTAMEIELRTKYPA